MLDFTDFGGILVHSMFDRLSFPRLREVILHNIDNKTREEFQGFRLSKYLQPTLHSLKLVDRTNDNIKDKINWLTASS